MTVNIASIKAYIHYTFLINRHSGIQMKKYSLLLLLSFTTLFNNAFAGDVNRAQFTSQIENREPVDQLVSVPAEMQKAFYFTELLDFKGETITHQWMFQGQEMYRLSFEVKGPRWRVWSSKRMLPRWSGSWTVNVLDSNDHIIKHDSFVYLP